MTTSNDTAPFAYTADVAGVLVAVMECIVAEYLETPGRLPMASSVTLNLDEARKAIASGNVEARDASIVDASRYLFGILDDRHTKIVATFGRAAHEAREAARVEAMAEAAFAQRCAEGF